ncbi:MAG: hypothetical protein WA906_03030 [Pacificimonas sp.]
MRSLILATALPVFLVACEDAPPTPAEIAREQAAEVRDQADDRADELEERADEVREQGEQRAEELEARAEALESGQPLPGTQQQ